MKNFLKLILLTFLAFCFTEVDGSNIDFIKLEELLDDNQFVEIDTWSDELLNKAGTSRVYDLELKLFNALVFREIGSADRALEIMYAGLEEANKIGDKELIVLFNYYLGKSFSDDANYGLENFKAALSQVNEASPYHPRILKSIGDIYLKQARGFNDNVDTQKHCDTSAHYYKEALLSPAISADSTFIGTVYRNLSSCMFLKGNNDQALFFGNAAIQVTSSSDKEAQAFNQIALGNLYFQRGDFPLAIASYKKAIAEKNERRSAYRNRDVYANIGYAFKFLEEPDSAVQYFELSTTEHSRFSSNAFTQKDAVQAEKNLLISKFENEITEQELVAQRSKKRMRWLIAGLLFLSLLFGYIFYTQRRNQILKQQNYELQIHSAEMQKQKELAQKEEAMKDEIIDAGLEAKEHERREISELLHNGVAALLSSANLHIAALKKYNITDLPELQKAKSLILEAGNQVRRLSHSLVSPVLIKFGLQKAVIHLADLISNDQVVFKVESDIGNTRLPVEFESKVYSIVKELCQNVIKHSNATKTLITMHLEENKLIFSVKDNGKGMDQQAAKTKSKMGLGIGQIASIARAMKGTVDIDTSPAGTSVNLMLPVPATHSQELAEL